ncbi:MAG: hypothetical protein A2365_02735 [Candidatus Nealsonbacteria bacterium RIFOXYB1_FULL_40_15]|uniref:Uncharacterized protein n=2 Tax=Candidatus Nealsoniibacteriota TaxID=1817911 RepID=A0A1G2EPN1_9BACT|nr:MAG: hypothetical protein A2365_02735 [Candidatus Nealsonbacteria bacterium RIFOXYB1_FULL_40_15]OGZ27512.1 MAG: hypothetical protein A2427_01590 [Candidatus Nealsonbacteria bacterium RIFOXYC1_FULL_40_7]OGZ28168.1 MAG: hypothetical protein A2562_02995 [Candidatus Nealsonbacteria bacterium RIFOXYD1_FULL_39_11]
MKEKAKKYFLPGIGIAASVYCSAAFAAGAIIGFALIEFFMNKFLKTGKVRMLKFRYKEWEIHLHHWIWPVIIISGVCIISTIAAIPLFILGLLNGLIFHDIYTHNKWKDDDKRWYHVVYKKV